MSNLFPWEAQLGWAFMESNVIFDLSETIDSRADLQVPEAFYGKFVDSLWNEAQDHRSLIRHTLNQDLIYNERNKP